MECKAKGCEVVVSGKLRGQRAKSMKFVDGLMIHSGEPTNDFVDSATRHVLLRQGTVVTYLTFLFSFSAYLILKFILQECWVSKLRLCYLGILLARWVQRSPSQITSVSWTGKRKLYLLAHLAISNPQNQKFRLFRACEMYFATNKKCWK